VDVTFRQTTPRGLEDGSLHLLGPAYFVMLFAASHVLAQKQNKKPSGKSQMTNTAERIVLASRLVGEPTLDNFRLEEFPIPQSGPGQILLRTLWLSLGPYMRGRLVTRFVFQSGYPSALSLNLPFGIPCAYAGSNEMLMFGFTIHLQM